MSELSRSVYESLVKEYLELVCGYFVMQDVPFWKDGGWSDIDIVSVKHEEGKITDGLIAEVKGNSLNKKEVDEIIEHFNHSGLQKKVKELGLVNPQKTIYCWYSGPEVREYAQQKGIIMVFFDDLIDIIKQKIEEWEKEKRWFHDVRFPIITILQFIFRHYMKQ